MAHEARARDMTFFTLAVAAEAVTGIALLASPNGVAGLLLGVDLDPAGLVMSRFAGVALISFAMACWPKPGGPSSSARHAMLVFQPATASVLALVSLATGLAGHLMWPAVVYHTVATYLIWRSR